MRGAEIFACQLSVELVKKGITADVLYLFDGDTQMEPYDLKFIPLHGKISSRFWDIKGFKRLADIVIEGGYDIVQANAGDTVKYAVFSRMLFCWKAKVIFRNASFLSSVYHGKLHSVFNRWLLSHCDFIISVSENCRQDLITHYRGAQNRSVTIPTGSYNFNHVPVFARDTLEPVLLSIGSMVRDKNHTFLLEIFDEFFRTTKSGFLWLVGDGKLRQSLEETVNHAEWHNRVRFFGYRSDVISILKAADVLVMPSVVEGIPGTILEAFSCGIPVIASCVGGVPEIVDNEVNGFCISEWSPAVYVDRIQKILTDSQLRNRFINNSRSKFEDHYTMNRIATRFQQAYADILRMRNNRATA